MPVNLSLLPSVVATSCRSFNADCRATTQQKQEAIISSRGDGLSDIMAKLRYQIEPVLAQQIDRQAG